jgi:hypothetical protein
MFSTREERCANRTLVPQQRRAQARPAAGSANLPAATDPAMRCIDWLALADKVGGVGGEGVSLGRMQQNGAGFAQCRTGFRPSCALHRRLGPGS